MFLDRLRTAQPNSACVMESFDVTALYTNVSNDSAMQAIFELLTQHEREINIWSGKNYAQIRGLAMGQRLAPSLAIAFMSKVEAPVTDLGPLLYCSPSYEYPDVSGSSTYCAAQQRVRDGVLRRYRPLYKRVE
ncbi:unnamed protein product [Angiostrongylus costaricensis]|uniref:Reverse transcriptase domain-containing protein n=1 Tax=Angiostrongylus costaricensis TaxID=334426 RepID=A0A0R3PZE6_ANGCS|nr:unnamed protein product [Angiostrongylus costaricensis]